MPGRSKRAIHKRFQREQTVSVLKSWECLTHTPTKPPSMKATIYTPLLRDYRLSRIIIKMIAIRDTVFNAKK